MPACKRHHARTRPGERLQVVDVDRIAVNLAPDFARRVASIACGDAKLPTNHGQLEAALRDAIAEHLRRAQEQA